MEQAPGLFASLVFVVVVHIPIFNYTIYINGHLFGYIRYLCLSYFFPVFFIFYRIHSTAGFCIQHEVKACIFTETTGIAQEWVLLVIINGSGKFKRQLQSQFHCNSVSFLGSLYNIHTMPTCTCGTDTHSLHSCHRLLDWQGLRRCNEDTAGSL